MGPGPVGVAEPGAVSGVELWAWSWGVGLPRSVEEDWRWTGCPGWVSAQCGYCCCW